MSDDERHKRERELYRERMADPDKREQILDKVRRYKERQRERMLIDAELHEAHLADERMRRRINGGPVEALRPAIGGYEPGLHEWVDPEPFLDFLRDTFGAVDPRDLEPILKIDAHRLNHLREQRRVSLSVVDFVLTAGLGRPDLLNALYPMEGAR